MERDKGTVCENCAYGWSDPCPREATCQAGSEFELDDAGEYIKEVE